MNILAKSIVQMLFNKHLLPSYMSHNAAVQKEIEGNVQEVLDMFAAGDFETDDERSRRLTEDDISGGKPIPNVRHEDGGYELQVLNFDNRWAKMRIIENDEIIFVPPNHLNQYIIINE